MIRTASRRIDASVAATSAAVLCTVVWMSWATRTIAEKGSQGVSDVVCVALAPVAAWFTWARPLVFPYGLYVILTPLDVLMQIGGGHRGATVARLLGMVAAIALGVYAVRTRSVRPPPRSIVWIGMLTGWMCLSTLWSPGADPGTESLTLVMLVALYLVLAAFPMQRRDVVPLLGAILLSGVVAAAIGIYEMHTGGMQTAQELEDTHRLTVTFGQSSLDPNMYGDGLLMPVSVARLWFSRAKRRLHTLAALAAMTILLLALALVGSRDATIGLAIVTVVTATLLRSWKRVLLPVTALGAGAIALIPNVIVRALADEGNGGSGRTSIWRVGITAFVHHPFFGTGSGSYGAVYNQWYLKVYERYDLGWQMASHNIFIHYGVELGIVGLVLVVGWCLSQWTLARALPKVGLIGDVRAVCLASLAGLGFAAFFIDLFDVKFVWVLFALIAQMRTLARSEARP